MNNVTLRAAMAGDAGNGAGMAREWRGGGGVGGAGAPVAPCPPVSPEGHGGLAGRARAGTPGRLAASAAGANGALNGAPNGASGRMPVDASGRMPADASGRMPADAEYVIYRLEESGRTLLALPQGGYSTRMRTSTIEMVRGALEEYGWSGSRAEQTRLRPAAPSAARITRMDEAMGWIALIPADRYVLRRIVGARSLVSPVTERHLFPWRRLGLLLGADHKAVQRWHAQGVDMIVAALNGRVVRRGR